MKLRRSIIDTSGKDLSYNLEADLSKKLLRVSLVIFFLMTSFSFAFLSYKTAFGVVAGGCIALFCFVELRITLEKTFSYISSGKTKAQGYLIGKYPVKLIVIAAFLVMLLKGGRVSAMGLAAGLFVFPATMIYVAISLYLNTGKKSAK